MGSQETLSHKLLHFFAHDHRNLACNSRLETRQWLGWMAGKAWVGAVLGLLYRAPPPKPPHLPLPLEATKKGGRGCGLPLCRGFHKKTVLPFPPLAGAGLLPSFAQSLLPSPQTVRLRRASSESNSPILCFTSSLKDRGFFFGGGDLSHKNVHIDNQFCKAFVPRRVARCDGVLLGRVPHVPVCGSEGSFSPNVGLGSCRSDHRHREPLPLIPESGTERRCC